jgi:hypothetical protein
MILVSNFSVVPIKLKVDILCIIKGEITLEYNNLMDVMKYFSDEKPKEEKKKTPRKYQPKLKVNADFGSMLKILATTPKRWTSRVRARCLIKNGNIYKRITDRN